MTVKELITALLDCEMAATVTLGHAPGPLGILTPTINGYVILDRAEPVNPETGNTYRHDNDSVGNPRGNWSDNES
jgi:hypothetical protein